MMHDNSVIFTHEITAHLQEVHANDEMVVKAARVSTGSDNTAGAAGLINYLVRNRHGSPFEHTFFTWKVDAPIFVWREHMRHRIASYNEMCLAGSTEVFFESENGNGYWKRIDKHWEDWHQGVLDSLGRRRKLESVRNANVRSFDEETLERGRTRVVDVVQSGVKDVWRVRTESGREITSSFEHRYFTPDGWKCLSDLSVGDFVYTQHRHYRDVDPENRRVPWSLRRAIQVWTVSQRDAVVERYNGMCAVCGQRGSIVDHKVPVASSLKTALDEDNLQLLCNGCDKNKTRSEQHLRDTGRLGNVLTISADRIVSIEPTGREMTYDLVLEGPHHNFLGDGFVVHNSGRYSVLEPKFYVPLRERPLVQRGKAGEYTFVPGNKEQHDDVQRELRITAQCAYASYNRMLQAGVAREVARMCLPVNIYSQAYVTMNARALMNFLSLRTKDPESTFPSYPQYEIEQVARQYEQTFAEYMPMTYAAFTNNGRVAP